MDPKSIPIVSIIERTGIKLQRSGNLYKTLCPFHSEKTPSFTVYPNTNSWCCFGSCSVKGGDGIDFIKQRYQLNYYQAIQWLEDNFTFNIKSEPIKFSAPVQPKVVPPIFITYWHNLLQDQRQYFYSRGFEDEIINREMWGWDGERYCLPVWEGEPQYSNCLGVRRRRPDDKQGFKYIGLPGMNPATIWGRWYCKNAEAVLGFAGELDAARAVQDGFAAFSLVNGVQSLKKFPNDWPQQWFPHSKRCIVVFDKKEEYLAGQLAHHWNRIKGTMMARVFQWPPIFNIKDYCQFRDDYNVECFEELLKQQGMTNGCRTKS